MSATISGISQAQTRDRRSPVQQVSACVSARKELKCLNDLAHVETVFAKHMGAKGRAEFQKGKNKSLIQQAERLLVKVLLPTVYT